MNSPRHLYVHAPFCARRCSYCDFAVHVARRPPVGAWLDAIEGELRLQLGAGDWEAPLVLDTLYLGGGTPSLLGRGAAAALRDRMAPLASAPSLEWTAEANPESFDEALARDWLSAGVTRLSLGVQTFHAPALRWMGRLHGPEGPARAMAAARAAGFEDVSVDLIFALPAELERDWRADLEAVLALEPEHVSLYGLTAEPAAALGRWVREGRATLPDDDRYEDEYRLAVELLGSAGFEHYEVSNFARAGHRSRHNGAYWTGAPYLGLGPGAHSYTAPHRWWNVRDWARYADAVQSGDAVEDREIVAGESARLEGIWLGLRHDGGYVLSDRQYDSKATGAKLQRLLRRWHASGWLGEMSPADHTLRLTAAGWLLLDRLAVELDEALSEVPDDVRGEKLSEVPDDVRDEALDAVRDDACDRAPDEALARVDAGRGRATDSPRPERAGVEV